jgi:hypothetical protein
MQLLTEDGRVVAGEVERASTFVQRGLGLMFRASLPPEHGLAITPCNSIHMFFMRFALDVAFLDREGRVVRVYRGIRPWRVSRIVRGARTAVELPVGTLVGVEVGDVLRLV